MNNNENVNNNENGYSVISIDASGNRIFVTRKPVVPKNKDDEEFMRAAERMADYDFIDIPITNPGFRASKCEIVDVSDWKYESYEQLFTMINYYESSKRR